MQRLQMLLKHEQGGDPMGAVEHLKTLCCLGLKPESAMIAVTPLLHEIIPHGWTRMATIRPDASIGSGYAENPAAAGIFREHMWRFRRDRSSPMFLWTSCIHSVGIGWTLHLQGQGWLERAWYRELESPLDSCWVLDAMIGETGQTSAIVSLTRPRSARPFTAEDVERLDRLRPWLAHAFRPEPFDRAHVEGTAPIYAVGAPTRSSQMILTVDEKIVFQTPDLEFLLRVLANEPGDHTRPAAPRERLPPPLQMLIRRLATIGASNKPPRTQISTPYGVVTLEAKWLMPPNALPADVAKDPKSCLIAVTIELREHALARAARVLRESGATPAQMKVGVQLVLGMSKTAIAEGLGLKPATIADLTKKLYQTLDIHDSTELGLKIWLNERTGEAQRSALLGHLARE
jgi:DNA-binding CsgD family transcriptional regulator